MTEVNIIATPPSVNETAFKDLVRDLMENSLSGDTSPFNEVKESLIDELEKSPDLDANQKAGIIADFMRDTFMDLNKQSMAMALDILKTNEELTLKTYSVEADYNLALKKGDNLVIENEILAKSLLLKEKETAIATEKIYESQLSQLEIRARLKKQYGVEDKITYVADGSSYSLDIDNRWYKVDPITGDWILDGALAKIPMIITGTSPIVQELLNTTEPGAIDKQIAGYDKVNYKDLLKTYNENISMLGNAQISPPKWMVNTTKLLTEMITDGQINITGDGVALPLDGAPSTDTTTVAYSAGGSTPGL